MANNEQHYYHYTYLPSFGPDPVFINCPYCHQQITTRIKTDKSVLQWLLAGTLCVVCCPISCCVAPIPFFIRNMEMVTHSCPDCNMTLGRYNGGC